jgi:ppGpp synthetase/RelA/SpoT-type nucleotidyltranferase
MELHTFLETFRFDERQFEQSGISWEELLAIADDYNRNLPDLEAIGRYVVDIILKNKIVHSINYRLKDPDHLLSKIVRKRLESPDDCIDIDNYKDRITDLIGIRALHLFKEDWIRIHRYIIANWELAEQPVAYVREGDSERILDFYRENECAIEFHKFGYRSVHYSLTTSPNKHRFVIEMQVRTLFEEAWGEIDHTVRYPYNLDNDVLARLSSILNSISGNADEIGSYMLYMKSRQDKLEAEYSETIQEKNRLIARLRQQVEALSIDSHQREAINAGLETLRETVGRNESIPVPDSDVFPWLSNFLESSIFKGIQGQLNKFMQSEYFTPIAANEQDIETLVKTRSEILKAIGDPEKLRKLLAGPTGMDGLMDLQDLQMLQELPGFPLVPTGDLDGTENASPTVAPQTVDPQSEGHADT